ncbi:MAG: DUF2520 domain-containing protein [Bacteroidota bacterium]
MSKSFDPSTWRVAVIGAGNLSWNLIPNLQAHRVEVVQLITRSTRKLKKFADVYGIPARSTYLDEIVKSANLVFLNVSDHAISEVATQLAPHVNPEAIYVHASGSIGLDALAPMGENIGVFYPMQIFTQAKVADFSELPIFLEGNEEVYRRLLPLARTLSRRVQRMSSEDRMRLHIGAVMVCNFVNHLFKTARDAMPGTDFEIYEPLIREHIDKVFTVGPQNTQTGPAIRGDMITLQKHLHLLEGQPELQELYRKLSMGINPKLEL